MAVIQMRRLCEENGADQLALVSSRPPPIAASPAEHSDRGADQDIVDELVCKLCKTLEELAQSRASREGADAERQELHEELQRLKDELGTSELKLHSANAELQSAKRAVEAAGNDINNLLSCSEVGTLILDARLRVKLFTKAASKLISLSDCDHGRPLSHLSRIVEDAQLLDDCRAVLAGSVSEELEIADPGHARYLRRLEPYRTADGDVGGVVITYVDCTTWAARESRLSQSEGDRRTTLDMSQILQLKHTSPEDRAMVCGRIREAIEDDQREVPLVPGNMLDVTEYEETRNKLRTMLDTGADAIMIVDGMARILSFNPAAERIFQRTTQDAVCQDIVTLFGSVSGRLLMQAFRHEQGAEDPATQWICERGGRPLDGLRGDGEVFPAKVSVQPVEGCDLFLIMACDLSERRRLEREIFELGRHKQFEIGREIHDGLGQELTALLMMASRMEHTLSRFDDPPCTADFSRITQCLRRAFETARRLSKGLTAADIAPKGLLVALQELSERMESASGIECSFSFAGNVDIDGQSRIAHLYRIAQEALSNAVRYAEADLIEMRLEGMPQGLLLSVRDYGRGIHPTMDSGDGLGLHLMRYRAGILGGACTIESKSGGGTLVRCEVPLHGADL